MTKYGPYLPISKEVHATKYRGPGESFDDAMVRIAQALKDDDNHYWAFLDLLRRQAYMPAGRIQAAVGSPKIVTPYNCFVSGTIPDSMDGIMDRLKEAAQTLRMGGGIGYDFSTLRPRKSLITTLDSEASGAVSFMEPFDAVCGTISSAGHRRGAQMAVLRVDHPDIEEYVESKTNQHRFRNFNISVGVTDKFMLCLESGEPFPLVFEGKVHRYVDARALWDKIMRATWDWAEPGVLFLDTANRMNNLWYCEHLAATNPCAEQWLPPYGACLLGSYNLTQFLAFDHEGYYFDHAAFKASIPTVVRAMDNVIERATYPLPQQEYEAKAKRRMGIGVAGLANTLEVIGHPYGSEGFLLMEEVILRTLANETYRASALLAKEKGAFPLYDALQYPASEFILKLDEDVQDLILEYGIRNSHLTSIAPTGTISLSANNISSGIEPVFSHSYERTINMPDGQRQELVQDWAVREHGVYGKTADQCSVDDHLNVLLVAQEWIDSSVSKTCNIGDNVTWEQFKDVYLRAYKGGAKGCTTFRASGKRFGILNVVSEEAKVTEAQDEPEVEVVEGSACYYDPATGKKSCE